MKLLIILVTLIMIITGCSAGTENEKDVVYETRNPTAEEILNKYKETDIFLFDDIVYVNAEDVDWVKQKDLTLGDVILDISKQTDKGEDFVHGTASKLPIGTKIYEPLEKGDIYIAVVDGKETRYLGLREG